MGIGRKFRTKFSRFSFLRSPQLFCRAKDKISPKDAIDMETVFSGSKLASATGMN